MRQDDRRDRVAAALDRNAPELSSADPSEISGDADVAAGGVFLGGRSFLSPFDGHFVAADCGHVDGLGVTTFTMPIRNGALPSGKFPIVVSFAVVAPALIVSARVDRASGKIATTPQ